MLKPELATNKKFQKSAARLYTLQNSLQRTVERTDLQMWISFSEPVFANKAWASGPIEILSRSSCKVLTDFLMTSFLQWTD